MRKREFISGMTKREYISLFAYLLIYTIAFPFLINWHSLNHPGVFTLLQYNVAYLVISFTVVLILAFRYLRREFDTLLDNKLLTFITLVRAYLMNLALSYAMILVVVVLFGDTEWTNPNNEAVVGMAMDDVVKVLGMTVFLGPIVEEVLFRGVIFSWIRKRDRLAAYIVTILLFSLLHVWQYAFSEWDIMVLIYALDYIPVSLVLCWCYETSGNIWCSILFHMGVNASSLMLLV